MNNYLLNYILISSFTLMGLVAMYGKVNYNLGSESEVQMFRNLVCSFIIYSIVDIIWVIIIYNGLFKTPFTTHVFTIGDLMFIGIIPYYWFLYVAEFLKSERFRTGPARYICRGIIFIYILLLISSFKTGFIYKIDENCIIETNKYTKYILLSIASFFFGSATLHGIIKFIRPGNREIKKRAAMVVVVILPVALGIIGYIRYRLAISVSPAVFTSIIIFFILIEDGMVYTDNLTGLSNRRKLDLILEDKHIVFSEDNPLIIYYMDIDKFKDINDNFGHFEGDRVLKILGRALKIIEFRYNASAIRVGGDEFIIAALENDIKDLNFKKIIRDEIKICKEGENLKYDISVSIGESRCNDKYIDLNSYIDMADSRMYAEKKRKKLER